MRKIAIGNTFRIVWALKQLGEYFNVENKVFDVEVSCPYGFIVISDFVAEGNTISFAIPASQQVYAGVYDIKLEITEESTNSYWALRQCNAFVLAPCCECSDVVEVVQLDSNIIYPSNGLSAYDIAVLNGYKGSYDEWVKWYAKPNIMRISFSPYGSNESYSLGEVSGELFEKFFNEIPESTWADGYSYYYGDMGQDENFSGIGEWEEINNEELAEDGEVSS